MHRWLNDWIMNYVDGDPANSGANQGTETSGGGGSDRRRCGRQSGLLLAKFYLRPHYHRGIDGFTAAGLQATVGEGGLVTSFGMEATIVGKVSVGADNF